MTKFLKIIIILLVLGLFGLGWFYQQCFSARTWPDGTDNIIKINKGDGVKVIGSKLAQAGYIKSKSCFELYVWLVNKESEMKAGEYEMTGGLNIKQIVALLASGQVISQEKNIKIIEGWNLKDINDYLQKAGLTSGDSFMSLANAPIGEWKLDIKRPDFLADAPASATLEGYLFPDTYRVFKDASVQDVIGKMLNNFNTKLDEKMRADIVKQGRTIHNVVIMASILEKEVRTAEDMKIVSGVFWDRIKNGQALESCATLAYILGVNKKQYTADDTQIDSPYNTYRYRDLPPGPISNPGLNALKAAVYPEYTDYNYFLSRSDNGQTVFSKTYEEHLRNKAKYLP